MKIDLFSIGAGGAAQPEILVRIARKAETVGVESIFAPEHPGLFAPEAYNSPYPYATAKGSRATLMHGKTYRACRLCLLTSV